MDAALSKVISFSMAMWLHGFQLAQYFQSEIKYAWQYGHQNMPNIMYVIRNGQLQCRKNTCSQEEHFFIEENYF